MSKFKKLKSGTELPLLNLKGKDYLPVAHRLVWFREEHPNGVIKTQILHHVDEMAISRAEIYGFNEETKQPYLLATAHKMETKAGFADYIEKSETGAIGRALGMCGYGTQYAPEFDEGERLADAPLETQPKKPKKDVLQSAKEAINKVVDSSKDSKDNGVKKGPDLWQS